MIALDLSSGKAADARRRLVHQLERHPDNSALVLMSGKVLLAERQYARAEAMLRRAGELDRSKPRESYTLLGHLLIAEKRLAAASTAFAAVIERDPMSSEAHTMLGLLMHAQRRVPEAVAHYEKALEADPYAVAAANNLAWLLAKNDQKLDRAFELARVAHARQPTNPQVVDTLGWVVLQAWRAAIGDYDSRAAVQLDAANPLYTYHLGLAYAKDGSDAKARKALERPQLTAGFRSRRRRAEDSRDARLLTHPVEIRLVSLTGC